MVQEYLTEIPALYYLRILYCITSGIPANTETCIIKRNLFSVPRDVFFTVLIIALFINFVYIYSKTCQKRYLYITEFCLEQKNSWFRPKYNAIQYNYNYNKWKAQDRNLSKKEILARSSQFRFNKFYFVYIQTKVIKNKLDNKL